MNLKPAARYIEGRDRRPPLTQDQRVRSDWNPHRPCRRSCSMVPTVAPDPLHPRPDDRSRAAAAGHPRDGGRVPRVRPRARLHPVGPASARRLHRGAQDLATEIPKVRATLVDSYAKWVESVDFRRLPDRHDQRHVESSFWADLRANIRAAARRRGKKNLSCSARRSTATTRSSELHAADDARQRLLLLAALYGLLRGLRERAPRRPQQSGRTRSKRCGTRSRRTTGRRRSREASSGSTRRGTSSAFLREAPRELHRQPRTWARFLYDAAGDVPR